MPTSGMVLGKFMPPHLGHVYLVDFARSFVDQLTVVVCSLRSEPIPGELRYRWMRELFPDANVVHLTDEIPQTPEEHPDFWTIWRTSLLRLLPGAPDFVFAGEDYGWKLAEVLGARFIPLDRRAPSLAGVPEVFETLGVHYAPGAGTGPPDPASGTAVRQRPLFNWAYLPRCVRPYFLRRVCVFGPESTGKTTLAGRLAEHFHTVLVPEYARTYLEKQGGKVALADMEFIARGQLASELALERSANRLLVSDTDLLTTLIWSETLFGYCPDWIRTAAERRSYDLYLLLDVDVPWVVDAVRYLPEDRAGFFQRCQEELDRRRRPYIIIRGNWEQRFTAACQAIQDLLDKG